MEREPPRKNARLSSEKRESVRQLCRRSELRSALTLAVDWGVVVGAVWLSLRFPATWVYLLSVLLISRQMNSISELHHHAMHYNLFRSRRLNEALEFLYSLPLFNRVAADRASHMEHHLTYSVANKDDLDW